MATWIALLRGINVGGSGRLAMNDLAKVFRQAGCRSVRTYIQSGNVVFEADIDSAEDFADDIGRAVERGFGFRPAVRLVPARALRRIISGNPYPEAESAPRSVHVFFLASAPKKPGLDRAKRLLAASEKFRVSGKTLYLHAPDGIGRSKFVRGVDAALGVPTTARNWKTVTKLDELAASVP